DSKRFDKKYVVGFWLTAATYWVTRLYHLDILPMFLDEAIHIRWALRMLEGGPAWKPWLHGRLLNVWAKAIVIEQFDDYLWAGRFVSLAIGFVGWLTCYWIGKRLMGQRAALIAAIFHVLCPFTLLHHRMALADSFLSAFSGLTLYLSIRTVQETRLLWSLLLGLSMTLGVLSKVPGLLLFCVPLFALALMRPLQPQWRAALVRAYAVGLALVVYPLWRFWDRSPLFGQSLLNTTGAEVTRSVGENLALAAIWLWTYWTWPLLLLGVAGLAWGILTRSRSALLLGLNAALPVGVFVVVSDLWFPRYLLFATIPFLLLAASALAALSSWIGARWRHPALVSTLLTLFAVAPSLRFDWWLLTDPPRAPLPRIDRDAYINGWSSGYGVQDVFAFLDARLAASPREIVVVLQATAEQMTYRTLDLHYRRQPRLAVERLDLCQAESTSRLLAWSSTKDVYVVLTPDGDGMVWPPQLAALRPLAPSLALERVTRKPDGHEWNHVYQLNPQPARRPTQGAGPL
ncbi:MAG: glycosyltransferase family 39 protein, partial [Vicinamibacteria bacterium]|nr:glycosyltransferase family 39 protein [Vicinamibacteria bacterium]